MVYWILWVLGLFVLQTLLPTAMRYLMAETGTAERLKTALGPRDEQPSMPRMGERAQRALANMQEAMPVFLTIALLNLHLGTAGELAVNGAKIFFFARLLYVPAYLSGIPGLRSVLWAASWWGLVMMLMPLHRGGF